MGSRVGGKIGIAVGGDGGLAGTTCRGVGCGGGVTFSRADALCWGCGKCETKPALLRYKRIYLLRQSRYYDKDDMASTTTTSP